MTIEIEAPNLFAPDEHIESADEGRAAKAMVEQLTIALKAAEEGRLRNLMLVAHIEAEKEQITAGIFSCKGGGVDSIAHFLLCAGQTLSGYAKSMKKAILDDQQVRSRQSSQTDTPS